MTAKQYNCTYQDVIAFLEENGFSFSEGVNDSCESWIKFARSGEPNLIVEITQPKAFFGNREFEKMVGQSKIPKEQWSKWVTSSHSA
jgi:hypothetical protein